ILLSFIGHPEIFPLVLTTKTQEIFNCRVDEDVTEENCFKIIKKEDIIQDLGPLESAVNPRQSNTFLLPEIKCLLLFVGGSQATSLLPSSHYKEIPHSNFCESSSEYFSLPRMFLQKHSLLLTMEIHLFQIKFKISRVRRKFGAPIAFADKNASHETDSYVECTSYEDKTFSIKMLEKDVGVQIVPKVREASTQTKWTYPKNAATQYCPREFSEEEKAESLSSERLKEFLTSVHLRVEIALQQNEIMNAFFDDWKALAEDKSSSDGKPDVYLKAHQSFTNLQYLKDRTISCVCWHPMASGIIAVSAREQLSYEEQIKLSKKSRLHRSVILFWSFSDPIHPQLILECLEDIYCFQFSPSDPNIVAGGCTNGQVVLWDISQYGEKLQIEKPVADEVVDSDSEATAVAEVATKSSTEPPLVKYCAVSSREYSHKKPVTDIQWLPHHSEDNQNRGENCLQLVTCSPDCSILFWDIPAIEHREKPSSGVPDTSKHLDLSWKPLIKISLDEGDTNTEYGPIRIILRELHYRYKTSGKAKSLSAVRAPAKESPYTEMSSSSSKNLEVLENISANFFVGNEDGVIVYSDWKMKIDTNSAKPVSQQQTQKYSLHTETINTLQRSPFFEDTFLSIGGQNFAIWKEGVTNGPILQSSCSAGRYTAGQWSLARPGVFFIGRDDGNLDIWDLLKKTHEPSHFQNISKSVITFISPWTASPEQHFLAVSDNLGVLHVLEICQTLSHPSSNEHANVLDFFEREVKYLK
ncbi:WD repeat-containing protein 63, partial [Manacus vitellinus]